MNLRFPLTLIAMLGVAAASVLWFGPFKGDLEYVVTKTEFVKADLVKTGEINRMTRLPEQKRIDAIHLVYLRGKQSEKDYPALQVKETHYREFTVGQVVSRELVSAAKK